SPLDHYRRGGTDAAHPESAGVQGNPEGRHRALGHRGRARPRDGSSGMTTMQPRELWSTMPGWGIVANLIPPELLQARRVRALQKLVGFLLVLLLLVAGAGGGYAMLRSHHASQQLSVEQNRTSQLLAEQTRYRSVT